jgi:hypothetical protein
VDWTYHQNGFLGKAPCGYFFVYEKVSEERINDRWFVTFEAGTDEYQGIGQLISPPCGYGSAAHAKRGIVAFLKMMDEAPSVAAGKIVQFHST